MLKKYLLLVLAGFGLTALIVNSAQASQAAELSSINVERAADGTEYLAADADGRYRYWINFNSAGALERVRQAAARGVSDLDADQARSMIQAEQAAAVESISSALQRGLNPSHYFLSSRNAVGARLTPSEADALRAMSNIASVVREQVYQLDTFRGPEFIGADQIWSGAAVPSGAGMRGEGIVAAVMDSGGNTDHPSFANDPACGHGVSGAPNKVLSFADCSSADGTGRCNGLNEEDTNGHGSHTASTVAGNIVTTADDPALNLPNPYTQISGVAHCANLRIYKVCPGSSCPGFDIGAGLDTILLDGDVDVMNYSISGGRDPWLDFDRTKLDLVATDIFIAASAGNTRPTIPDPVGQVNHRGPWVMSVAASTRDGDFTGTMSLTAPGSPPAATQDIAMDPGSDSPLGASLVDKSIRRDTNQNFDAEGCNIAEGGVDFPAGFFNNAVALVRRGSCSFTDKINNAAAAGADMVVIWNNVAGTVSMNTAGQAAVPAYSITQADGQAVADFIDANPTTTEMSFDLVPSSGDVLGGFSLRGPTPAPYANIQKPNITGPGVDIFAAVADPGQYGFLSGTSMSSPHVAGAAALVRQARPEWNAIEVQSALQMTAIQEGFKEDQSTQWDWDDIGSGRVDLTVAALAGLVMNETIANFIAADPDAGGDVRTLNIPSVRDVACDPDCTFIRTVTAALNVDSNWTVSTVDNGQFTVSVQPSSFTLGPRPDLIFSDGWEAVADPVPQAGEQELTITISNVNAGPIRFGVINLTEDAAQAPDAHMTIAVQR